MTNVITNREFVIVLENKPGTVAEVATALGKANINIQGYLVNATGEFGTIRIVTSDPTKTESWLKSTNRVYQSHDVVTVPIQNKPGELGTFASTLAKSGVNIQASYATAVPNGIGLTFAVNDLNSARKVLNG